MGCVQLIESWYDARFLVVILFVVVCGRVAFLTMKKRYGKDDFKKKAE